MIVGGYQVPQAVAEVAGEFPTLSVDVTDRDIVLKGLLPYTFKGRQYNTPVLLFRSRRPAQGEDCFRCRIDLDAAPTLMVSAKALYIERISGAVLLEPPPTLHDSFVSYVRRIQAAFSGAPPLIQRGGGSTGSSMANGTGAGATAATTAAPLAFERYLLGVLSDISLFHATALQYSSQTHTIKGVVPIQFRSRPYAIPVEIKLNPEDFACAPPLVFVTPTASMVLVATEFVAGDSGLVETPAMRQWKRCGGPPVRMLEMLREMQDVFARQPPVVSSSSGATVVASRTGAAAAETAANSQEACAPLQSSPSGSPTGSPSGSPPPPAENERLCVICMDTVPDCVFLPCRHMSVCRGCAGAFRGPAARCPMCRAGIENVIEVFV